MLKVSFLFMLLLSHSAYAQQRQISHVDISGSWYHVYDTNGKRITTLANSSVGEIYPYYIKKHKIYAINVYNCMKISNFADVNSNEIRDRTPDFLIKFRS